MNAITARIRVIMRLCYLRESRHRKRPCGLVLTRIVTYYVGLSSLGLWGFNFFETLSFYLNQKVSAIFILSESESVGHFHLSELKSLRFFYM